MHDADRLVTRRFPEHAERIGDLSRSNTEFHTLCHRYGEVSDKLVRLESMPAAYVEVEAEMLRRRRAALADEILAMMREADEN